MLNSYFFITKGAVPWYNFPMENDNLYMSVKKNLCESIYRGVYKNGDKIPPERVLSEQLKVSRVTVRKALEIMEQGKLIVREVGSGTRVQFHNYGWRKDMEMLVLAAPVRNVFFPCFIQHFQRYANANGSLLLYLEKPEENSMEDCLYQLYERGFCHVVIWSDERKLDRGKIECLRALGMNLVFFGTDAGLPFGDCVIPDIDQGMEKLCQSVRRKKNSKLGYIGLENDQSYEAWHCKQAFLTTGIPGRVLLELHGNGKDSALQIKKELEHLAGKGKLPDGIVCGNGEIAVQTAKRLQKMKVKNVKAASIEDLENPGKYGITTYRQDFDEIVKVIFQCLEEQNQKGERWRARICKVAGEIWMENSK